MFQYSAFLTGVSCGLLLATLSLITITRRYFQNKAIGKAAFQKLIGRVYHKDQIPTAARIEGLMNLSVPGLIRLLNLLELASRPNHQGYISLAQEETESVLELNRLCQIESRNLRLKIIEILKEHEHLQ